MSRDDQNGAGDTNVWPKQFKSVWEEEIRTEHWADNSSYQGSGSFISLISHNSVSKVSLNFRNDQKKNAWISLKTV